jgi:hypothetical protein
VLFYVHIFFVGVKMGRALFEFLKRRRGYLSQEKTRAFPWGWRERWGWGGLGGQFFIFFLSYFFNILILF